MERRMTSNNSLPPEDARPRKAGKKGFRALAIIVAFVVLTLAATYFVRRHLLERAMCAAMEDGSDEAFKTLARSFPCPVNARDKHGRTPLHVAAMCCDRALVELLLNKGADINARDKQGWMPIHDAADNMRKDVAELLIARGADVNAKDNTGSTALAIAAGRGKVVPESNSVADVLRKAGARE